MAAQQRLRKAASEAARPKSGLLCKRGSRATPLALHATHDPALANLVIMAPSLAFRAPGLLVEGVGVACCPVTPTRAENNRLPRWPIERATFPAILSLCSRACFSGDSAWKRGANVRAFLERDCLSPTNICH